jgi:hypothetical protein
MMAFAANTINKLVAVKKLKVCHNAINPLKLIELQMQMVRLALSILLSGL